MRKSLHRLVTLLLVLLFFTSPLLAQQRRNAAPKKPVEAPEPAPTFDSLLASDSYKVYSEVRAVGALIRSPAVNDLLDPVVKLGGPPKEFKTVVKWLNAHAEVLASSRMLVASWPSRPKLPNVLMAIEFSSPEEAKKFYPELRGFIPTLLPTPTPAPTPAPGSPAPKPPTTGPAAPSAGPGTSDRVTGVQAVTSDAPPYRMKQVGSLILISDTDFTFRDLKPRGSRPLEEDPNFIQARNRFASESLFLYIETKSIEKEQKDRQKKWEEEEQKRIEAQAANPPKVEEQSPDAAAAADPGNQSQPPPPEPEPSFAPEPTQVDPPSDSQTSNTATLSAGPQRSEAEANAMMFSLYGAMFGGENRWPEAVSAAVAFEGDAYVLRTLILNGAENKGSAIPFVLPQFVSGPALVPESPNIFPADTDLFVSLSLDFPQVYDGMLKAMARAEEVSRRYSRQPARDGPPPETPFAVYEKKLGLKIKDDVLPLLGNEIALVLPKRVPSPSPTPTPANSGAEEITSPTGAQNNTAAVENNPIIAISVKDREAVGRLIPKIIESFGLKGASLIAQTEKRDSAEITSYGNFFAYAFVGDFLVVSADAAATRHVVDAYLNHQTLSSDSHFKNSTRWQPRQVLGQVYVAPGLVESYTSFATTGTPINDKLNEFLSRVNPVIEPLTYSLTNDGQGPLHELHVPRNLLQLIIAGISNEARQAPLQTNEAMAKTALRSVVGGEASFKSDKGDGRYGTLEELQSESLISKELLENYGYRVELTVSGTRFEATAVPAEYGKTGRLSFFIDESGVLRGGDHGGGAASISDQAID